MKLTVEQAYSIIGVSFGSDEDAVKTAYRAKSKQYHPDRGGNVEEFKKLNNAKEVVDEFLKKGGTAKQTQQGPKLYSFGGRTYTEKELNDLLIQRMMASIERDRRVLRDIERRSTISANALLLRAIVFITSLFLCPLFYQLGIGGKVILAMWVPAALFTFAFAKVVTEYLYDRK